MSFRRNAKRIISFKCAKSWGNNYFLCRGCHFDTTTFAMRLSPLPPTTSNKIETMFLDRPFAILGESNRPYVPLISSSQQQQPRNDVVDGGNGREMATQQGYHQPSIECVHYDRTIVRLFSLYFLLIILLFTWPEYVSAHFARDGHGLIAELMGILFFVGGTVFLISFILSGVTLRRWKKLSPWMKVFGLLPIAFSILLIIYFQILVEIDRRNHEDGPSCPTSDGVDCPKRNNTTDSSF